MIDFTLDELQLLWDALRDLAAQEKKSVRNKTIAGVRQKLVKLLREAQDGTPPWEPGTLAEAFYKEEKKSKP